jgi:sialate O-acetylesterase
MMTRSALLTAVLMLPLPLLAAVKVPAIFSDHLVLQAGKPVAVWGTAAAGEKVTVGFAAQEKSTTAGQDGAWSVKLDPLKASPEPQMLKINTLTIQDVLVGEVWLGSGQSNMAMQVKGAKELEASKAAAKLPQIRVFTEGSGAAETAQSGGKGNWIVCSPETVERFSATAYFFGRSLHEELKVPVGLIISAVGGTPIESWIDAAAQRAQPELKGFFEAMAAADAKFDEAAVKAAYEKQVEKWKEAVKVARAANMPLPQKPRDPIETRQRKGNVGGLFNGKIAPLIPTHFAEPSGIRARRTAPMTRLLTTKSSSRCWRRNGGSAGAMSFLLPGCNCRTSRAPAPAGRSCVMRCARPWRPSQTAAWPSRSTSAN